MGFFSLAAGGPAKRPNRAPAQGIGFRFQVAGPRLISRGPSNLRQAIQRRDQRVAIGTQTKNLFEGPLRRRIVAEEPGALGKAEPGVDAAGVGFERRREGRAGLDEVAAVELILGRLQAVTQSRPRAAVGLAAGGQPQAEAQGEGQEVSRRKVF